MAWPTLSSSAAAHWRAQQRDTQLAPLDLLVAAGWRLLPLAFTASAGVVVLIIAYRRWGGHAYIRAAHITRALEALHRHPAVPQTLSYTQHYAPHLRAPAALPDMEAPALQLPAVPSFAKLLADRRVGQGNPLLLGFDTASGAELVGSWLDLYSTAVSGMPGSGKTTSRRFLACQTALHGARFAICDPHAGAADDSLAATLAPLSAAFVCAPASGDKAILETVRYVADVGRRRVSG